ncbi:MAG: DUF6077 domain-containing protein [Eubacterium sp.]|nr:DUF6077 domain-containing protein [Eubacterium sp.]MCM1303353.1 DUF6077 domain-containing protein [Butyrivibrio sp.]MCM1342957.1 DUF6077 domain-containing protein [Muribaculaceae bacterium]MCM1411599.1 DUF6077 domain-containing protein [Lachnospiraceae bacterium]
MDLVQALLLALILVCLCGFLGSGAWILFYKTQRPEGADALPAGGLILTGLAVTAHAAAVFTGQSFSRCTVIFVCILGTALLFAAVLFLFYGLFRKKKKHTEKAAAVHKAVKPDGAEKLLMAVFGVLVVAQLLCLLWNAGVYVRGDMTVETVGSFLQTDSIYRVDPMTGQAYAEGIPTRLKILCLPALYGSLCRLSGLAPETVVTLAVPVWVFISSYASFACVGKSLFPESRKKRICFLITIVMIIWAGCGFHSLDGFGLLYCGYRGVTIRNLVILPYLISLCLRKRWRMVILCILAEACIVWTFYGMGACLLTAAGLFLAERRRRDGRAY